MYVYIYVCIIYNYILYIYTYIYIYIYIWCNIYYIIIFFSWKLLCFTVSPSGQTHTEGRWVPDISVWIHVQTLASRLILPSVWVIPSIVIKSPLFSTMHIASLQNPLTPPGFLCSLGWCTCGKPMTVNYAIYIHYYLISNNVLGISNLSMMSSTLPDIIWYCINLYHMTWQWSDSDTIRNGAAACGPVALCQVASSSAVSGQL